jgi:PleD family two-component response regulator
MGSLVRSLPDPSIQPCDKWAVAKRAPQLSCTIPPVYGRILLVEDDPSIREVATLGLRAAGFEVAAASDGVGGLDRFWADVPDLVLLDISCRAWTGSRCAAPSGANRRESD